MCSRDPTSDLVASSTLGTIFLSSGGPPIRVGNDGFWVTSTVAYPGPMPPDAKVVEWSEEEIERAGAKYRSSLAPGENPTIMGYTAWREQQADRLPGRTAISNYGAKSSFRTNSSPANAGLGQRLLTEYLSAGPKTTSEIRTAGDSDGFSWRALQHASRLVGVVSSRVGF
jgi:hypothetical protein